MDVEREDDFKPKDDFRAEAETLRALLALLSRVAPTARMRILKAAEAFVGEPVASASRPETRRPDLPRRLSYSFSDKARPDLQSFWLAKRPQTDVERVTCLAYYAAAYLDQSALTADSLHKLNQQVGKPLANPTNAARHAEHGGYLERIDPQSRRISALGRSIVDHLPDRVAVRRALKSARAK